MIKKIFIRPEAVRNNSFRLAKRIAQGRFKPTIIYAMMRGGAAVASSISEWFKYHNIPLKYGAVIVSSYINIGKQGKVKIEGWAPALSRLKPSDRVLIAEDLYDSGNTLNAIVGEILKKTKVRKNNIKIVVHDYKIYKYKKQARLKPDFYINKYIIISPEQDLWLHYDSHEAVGLAKKEIKKRYGSPVSGLF